MSARVAFIGLGNMGGPMAASIYREFADDGGAALDFSAIINTIRARSEVTA